MKTIKLYNNSVVVNFDERKHHYTINDKTIDGVTSVLSVINKPALVAWAANKASEYVNQNLPVGIAIDEIQKLKLVNGCKVAHRIFKDEAADIGKLFHVWAETYIKNEHPAMPTNPMLLKAVQQFLEWVEKNNIKFIASEQIVYSQKHNYIGTFDFIANINGKTVLGDIKTGSGIYDEFFLQVAAYKQAYLEEFFDKKIDHTVIVRCGKDGSFETKEMNEFDNNFKAFLGALILYRRLKELKFNPNKV